MKNIIEIKDLKKYFKEVKAVDGISFCVKEGQLFAFLGLNGAGKSTTINIICNLLEKDGGEVYIDGMSVDGNMHSIKPILGVVFQENTLDAKLSVYDNLKFRAGLYGLRGQRFQDKLNYLAERLQFKDILKRPFGKLSGGQQRRIDVARALIHSPKILILDEPTTGLDPNTRITVWEFLNELRRTTNLTILLTTHYMEEASESDYVVIIDRGKIVASDTPNNLKNQYAYDFIKIYDGADELKVRLDSDGVVYKEDGGYLLIEVKEITEAKEILTSYGKYFDDFEVIKGKMDNVFLNVTGKQLKEETK
ncbi:MAG: ABC transporter ATP-binding protein [Clostridia bacterium]|nr:ABC transporter ATP-binding protein [Clostridia bacterium]